MILGKSPLCFPDLNHMLSKKREPSKPDPANHNRMKILLKLVLDYSVRSGLACLWQTITFCGLFKSMSAYTGTTLKLELPCVKPLLALEK